VKRKIVQKTANSIRSNMLRERFQKREDRVCGWVPLNFSHGYKEVEPEGICLV
jgi:hypothetical protein